MIFTSQNSDIKGLANNFQILGNSIRQISRDLSKGAGLSSFTQKVDIDALRDFNAELRSGKSYVEAYKSTVANSNTVTRQQAVAYAKSGQTLSSFTANLQKTTAASKAGEIALKGLAMAGNMLVFALGSELISILISCANASDRLRDSAKELGDTFSTSVEDINSYKSQIEELYATINDSSSSYEDTYNARQNLLQIQDELIEKYGSEADAINLVTQAINGQTEALDQLSAQQWQETVNEFNAGNGLTEKISDFFVNLSGGYSSNFERFVDEVENATASFYVTPDNDEFAKILKEDLGLSSVFSEQRGEKFTLTGDLEDVYQQLLNIQSLAEDMGMNDSFLSSLSRQAGEVKSTLDDYQEFYNQYVLNDKIFGNAEYENIFNEINDAYKEYQDAFAKGDEDAINEAKQNFAEIVQSATEGIDDKSVVDYFNSMYPDLQAVVGSWDFEVKFKAALDDNSNNFENEIKDALANFESVEDIQNYNPEIATDEQITAYAKLNDVAREYGLTLDELISKLSQMGLIESQTKDDLLDRLIPSRTDLSAGFESAMSDAIAGVDSDVVTKWVNSLSEEDAFIANSDQFVQALKEQADSLDGATLSAEDYDSALQEVKNAQDQIEEVADTTATISSSVSQIATQLKPQFDELAEAYKEIFSEDGFSIDVVDNEMLENLRSAFEDIEEDVGVTFDTTELNKFFSVLTNGASTADEVQQAFNDLATAYLYSTDTMENLNDETAQAIEQQLQEMGVTNANEVVTAALAQKKAELSAENLYAAQTGGTLANATAAEIAAFAAEQVQLGNVNQAMYQVLMQKAQFNLTSINTAADIDNLYQLAQAAGATAQTLSALNAAKGRFGSTGSSNLDALRARKDAQRALKNQSQQADFGFEPVEIDFDGAYGTAKEDAGKAGKETGDKYVEEYEKSLQKINDLYDRGKITEKQRLDAMLALAKKYFADRAEYAEKYAELENEYLRGMKDLYESVMSGIISRIDDHIDALNDQKDAAIDALEAQKDAALEAIEAERDARKEALEEQKHQLQDQIDLIQSQIDAKQDEIDAINDAADATKRQADLEKALYEQKRAQEQRVNKVYSGQDRGFIYEADTSSIREADEAVEDAQREIRIANIEQEIKVLEKRRDALEDQQDLIDQQLDELDEYYDKLISNTEAYYDNLIASTEAAWDEIIKGFEETKSRWEELQELEEQAEFEANLRELGLSLDDVLNMSESQFAAFKDNYLGILADIYAGNDQMISSMSDLANVDMSALPGYLEETQQYIDMLSNGIDFTNLNDSLSSTITGFEDAAKAAGILTGAITGGGGSSSEGDKGKEGEGSGGESDSSGSGDSLLGATETLKTTGVENITEFGNAFSSGEDEEGGESVAGKVMKATASIVGAVGGGGSGGKGKGKGSGGEGSAEGGADSLMGGVALQTEAALDEEAGIPAQIAKWGELDEVLDGIITKLDTIKEKLEGLSEIDFSIPGLLGGAGHFEGTETGNSYATGTKHGLPSREHNAMISEFGPEIAVYPNGTYKLFTEPSIVDLPQGTAIFNTRQTLDILKGNKHIELGGTALFDGYDISGLENMRNLVSSHAADVLSKNPAIFTDFEVPESNQTTTVNLNGGIVLEGVQDVDALAKGIVQKLPLKMMQIMNKKEYRPRR